MALFIATALFLAQISAFATVTYSCSEYKEGECRTPEAVDTCS